MLKVLELKVSDGRRCEVEGQTWLVRLVDQVPHVDAVGLCDEDNSWTGWTEGAACVVGAESVCRFKDRLVETV